MNNPNGKRAIRVFEEALEQQPAERDAYLDQACQDDSTLRMEVESLLATDERAAGFLEPPGQARPNPGPEVDPLVGATVGRYHIQRVVAAGGMGTVYEAVQQNPGRTVALKMIRPGVASRSTLRRFRHESEILGRLRHPGIAQVYEAGTHGGRNSAPYFAMESIPGARPITRYAEEQELSTRERLDLFIQVCDAAHAGHRRGIIHRDLKPANILVDDSGRPKLIDFGVARATDADMTIATLQTDVGQLVGTLRYMSPEQCDGVAADLDTRSDVYALGVVLFELLTGELPYDLSTSSPFEVPKIIRAREPRRMPTVNRALRGDIETIVLKALEKDRDQRYQSVPELMRDIQHYLANEPIDAKRGRRWYVFCKTLRRHRVAIGIGAAFMLVVFASVLGLAFLYRDSERQRITAEQRAGELRRSVYLNDITLAQQAYEDGDGSALARHLANCPTDLRGWEWRYLNRLADTSVATLGGHTHVVAAVAVSPDGRLIASGDRGHTLCIWDGKTLERMRTLHTDGFAEIASFSPNERLFACSGRETSEANVWTAETWEPVAGLSIRTNAAHAFSPDGKYIAAGGYQQEPLRVWDVDTAQLVREWPDTKRVRPMNIVWSPDSRMIVTARSDGTVILLDVMSGDVTRSFEGHMADVHQVAFSPDGKLLASTSGDGTLRLWRADSGEQFRVLGAAGRRFSPSHSVPMERAWRPPTYLRCACGTSAMARRRPPGLATAATSTQ